MANTLREYLVKLGWDVDANGMRQFQNALSSVAAGAVELGEKLIGVGAAVAAVTLKMADGLERLYYMAQRTRTSAANLQAFQYAMGQVGLSAGEANAAIENLAANIRTNPIGTGGLLRMLGVERTTDKTQQLFNLVTRLKQIYGNQGDIGYARAAQRAGQLGINEQTFNNIYNNLDKAKAAYAANLKQQKAYGTNVGTAAEKSKDFNNSLRSTQERLKDIAETALPDYLTQGDKALSTSDRLLDTFKNLSPATQRWAADLGVLAAALGGVSIAGTALKAGLRLLGLGGAAEAGAATAGGAVATAAGVAATATGVGAFGIAAYLGAQAFDKMYGSKFRKSFGFTDDAATNWKIFTSKLDSAVFGSGEQSLAKSIAASEGLKLRASYDAAGKYSIGYGHQLKPGEDFSGSVTQQGAWKLLLSDIEKAASAVKGLVTRQLNDSQMRALTDFVYNLGSGALANSSKLLKEVNAGDWGAAAREIQRFNKVRTAHGYVADAGLTARRAQEAAMLTGGGGGGKPGVTVNQKTEITVHGTDAQSTANQVINRQKDVNGNLTRNLVGAIQ